jgi:hypothetical protein
MTRRGVSRSAVRRSTMGRIEAPDGYEWRLPSNGRQWHLVACGGEVALCGTTSTPWKAARRSLERDATLWDAAGMVCMECDTDARRPRM